MTTTRRLTALAFSTVFLTGPGVAADAGLFVNLNKAETVPSGCRLTYVVDNTTAQSLSGQSLLIDVFDAQGTYSRKVVFRFGGIGAGRTKVQQFDLVGAPCEDISRLLIDDITDCVSEDGTEMDCLGLLRTSSATDIDLAY